MRTLDRLAKTAPSGPRRTCRASWSERHVLSRTALSWTKRHLSGLSAFRACSPFGPDRLSAFVKNALLLPLALLGSIEQNRLNTSAKCFRGPHGRSGNCALCRRCKASCPRATGQAKMPGCWRNRGCCASRREELSPRAKGTRDPNERCSSKGKHPRVSGGARRRAEGQARGSAAQDQGTLG